LFPKQILEIIGYQDETIRSGQDYEFIVRICKHYTVAFLNNPTYVILHHGDQLSNQFKNNKNRRILDALDLENLFLKVVRTWAFEDKEYYNQNRHQVNERLAEIYLRLGVGWMEYGDDEKAKKCFEDCDIFDPIVRKYRKYLWLFSMPLIIRRIIFGILHKLKKWTLILKNRPSANRILINMRSK
jgi:hypothetical protein